jgi:hypothetical protein
MHFIIALMYYFSTVWLFLNLLSCSVSLVVFRSYRNCFIEERRFCYCFLRTFLTLNVISGHPVWKHNSLHRLFFLQDRKMKHCM